MTKPSSALTTMLYALLDGTAELARFEQWVYATPELEAALPADAYLELLALDYGQPRARQELCKLLEPAIEPAAYADWYVRARLRAILERGPGLERALEECYDLYCRGAGFLRPLLPYGLEVAARLEGEALDLEAFYPALIEVAGELLRQLDQGLALAVSQITPLRLETSEPGNPLP